MMELKSNTLIQLIHLLQLKDNSVSYRNFK